MINPSVAMSPPILGESEGVKSSLSSPFRNFTFETYPFFQNLHKKLANCGSNFATFLNTVTGEEISIPLFCDNRVCLNPDCQKHRLYKYMRKHNSQIVALNKDMRKPKGWVFTDVKRSYPIDKFYCQERFKELYYLLNKSKHPKYGSNSLFSIHMEIKLNADSWYLHFHGVTGGITNLRFIRKIWGKQIKFEDAINPIDLGYYVSKYASKVPHFPSKQAYLEYASATYKTQMHRFSSPIGGAKKISNWILLNINSDSISNAFFELDSWLNEYLNDYGFGS